MNYKAKTIRSFIGAKDYEESRSFYIALGYQEIVISEKMSLFKINEELGFYLQDYYLKDWVDNLMIFLEVDNVDECYKDLKAKELHKRFKQVRLKPIQTLEWGRECFLHDPSGVLWHFGQFN